jgi:hypothetical protein
VGFDSLVRKHSKEVYNLAYRITGNEHDAEDVTRETFLQVHWGDRALSRWKCHLHMDVSDCREREPADQAWIEQGLS